MTISLEDFLNDLTDWNRHSERVVVEAILSENEELIKGACEVLIKHLEDGFLSEENGKKRKEIASKLVEELALKIRGIIDEQD